MGRKRTAAQWIAEENGEVKSAEENAAFADLFCRAVLAALREEGLLSEEDFQRADQAMEENGR